MSEERYVLRIIGNGEEIFKLTIALHAQESSVSAILYIAHVILMSVCCVRSHEKEY